MLLTIFFPKFMIWLATFRIFNQGKIMKQLKFLLSFSIGSLVIVGVNQNAEASTIRTLWWDSTPSYGGQALDAFRQEMSDFLDTFDDGSIFDATYISSETPGTLSTHLLSNSYDVIVFDATSQTTKFNSADLAAIQTHYTNGNSNLMLDGTLYIRSINLNATTDFPGINEATGGLLANQVHQLGIRGGGIMIGTDHDCCQVDANQVLQAILPDAAFTGLTIPSTDGEFFGTDLLNSVTPVAPLDIFNHWNSVPSQAIAPTGIYTDFLGNDITLYTQVQAADAPGGGTKFPYISTSWTPGDQVIDIDDPEPPEPDPEQVPEPYSVIGLLAFGGINFLFRKGKKQNI